MRNEGYEQDELGSETVRGSSSLSYTQAAWILFIWELTWHMGIRESHALCIMHVIFLEPVALYTVPHKDKKLGSVQC